MSDNLYTAIMDFLYYEIKPSTRSIQIKRVQVKEFFVIHLFFIFYRKILSDVLYTVEKVLRTSTGNIRSGLVIKSPEKQNLLQKYYSVLSVFNDIY